MKLGKINKKFLFFLVFFFKFSFLVAEEKIQSVPLINLEELSHIIDSEDRTNAGYSVPACGLYLLNIKYPKIVLFELDAVI